MEYGLIHLHTSIRKHRETYNTVRNLNANARSLIGTARSQSTDGVASEANPSVPTSTVNSCQTEMMIDTSDQALDPDEQETRSSTEQKTNFRCKLPSLSGLPEETDTYADSNSVLQRDSKTNDRARVKSINLPTEVTASSDDVIIEIDLNSEAGDSSPCADAPDDRRRKSVATRVGRFLQRLIPCRGPTQCEQETDTLIPFIRYTV